MMQANGIVIHMVQRSLFNIEIFQLMRRRYWTELCEAKTPKNNPIINQLLIYFWSILDLLLYRPEERTSILFENLSLIIQLHCNVVSEALEILLCPVSAWKQPSVNF